MLDTRVFPQKTYLRSDYRLVVAKVKLKLKVKRRNCRGKKNIRWTRNYWKRKKWKSSG